MIQKLVLWFDCTFFECSSLYCHWLRLNIEFIGKVWPTLTIVTQDNSFMRFALFLSTLSEFKIWIQIKNWNIPFEFIKNVFIWDISDYFNLLAYVPQRFVRKQNMSLKKNPKYTAPLKHGRLKSACCKFLIVLYPLMATILSCKVPCQEKWNERWTRYFFL